MKLQLYLFIVAVIYSSPVFAESSLSAHLHGHLELNVAADGKKLFVEVHSPTQSFLGFEHRPKTDQQKNYGLQLKTNGKRKHRSCFKSILLWVVKSHRHI